MSDVRRRTDLRVPEDPAPSARARRARTAVRRSCAAGRGTTAPSPCPQRLEVTAQVAWPDRRPDRPREHEVVIRPHLRPSLLDGLGVPIRLHHFHDRPREGDRPPGPLRLEGGEHQLRRVCWRPHVYVPTETPNSSGVRHGPRPHRDVATLDLVGQAPGGPDEDPVGLPFGGWQAPLLDEVAGAQVGAAYEGTDALLLGRWTYDIVAALLAVPGRRGQRDRYALQQRPRSRWPPAAGPSSRGPGPRSSARTWPARCVRSVTGTST